MADGAGAWQRPRWYSRTTMGGKLEQTNDGDGKRQRLAGGAIQRELHRLGYLETGRFDGHFGALTELAIRAYQRDHDLPVDGAAGPLTLRHLVDSVCRAFESFGIPDRLLWGQIGLESAYDPGAEGVETQYGRDRGLAQVNDRAHPEVPDSIAYGDLRWSIDFAATGLFQARPGAGGPTYAQLGEWDCAVAAHNNPSKARAWFYANEAPDEQIANYVRLVRKYGTQAP